MYTFNDIELPKELDNAYSTRYNRNFHALRYIRCSNLHSGFYHPIIIAILDIVSVAPNPIIESPLNPRFHYKKCPIFVNQDGYRYNFIRVQGIVILPQYLITLRNDYGQPLQLCKNRNLSCSSYS